MQSSNASGNRPVKAVEERPAPAAGSEHVGRQAAECGETQDVKGQLYRSVMENAYIAITQIDKNYKILMVNNATGEYFSKPISEHIGRECFREFEKRRSVCPHCPGKQAMESGRPAQAETEGIRDDDGRFPVRIQAFPTIDPDGQITGFIEIIEDLTELKKAEGALRKGENTLRAVLSASPVGIGLARGRIIQWCNDAMCRLTGYSKEDVVGRSSKFLYADEAAYEQIDRELYSGISEKGIGEVDTRIRRKDGRIVDCYLQASPLDPKDISKGIIGAIVDITKLKRAEEAVRQQRDSAHKYLDIAGVIFVALNAKGEVILINQKGSEVLGYEQEEIIGKNWFDNFLPPRLRGQVRAIFEKLIAGRIEPVEYHENPILTKDHEERIVAWHNTTLTDEQGHITGTLGSGEDITERKRAEQALRKSEKKYRQLIETLQEGIWVIDKDAKTTFVNARMGEMLGYTVDEMQGRPLFSFMDESGRELCIRYLESRTQGIKEQHEFEFLRKDGSRIYTLIETSPLTDHDGNYVGSIAGVLDITSRKQAAQTVLQQKEILQTILDNIPVMIAFLNSDGSHKWVNRAWQEMLGWSLEDVQSLDVLREFYPDPKYRQYVVDFIRKAKSKWGDFRTRIRDGRILDTMWTNVPLSDGSNIGIGLDITDRKKAEEALKASEQKLKMAQKIANIGNWSWEIASDRVEWSDQVYEIFKAPHKKPSYEFAKSFVYPDDLELWQNTVQQAIETQKPFTLDYRAVRSDGKVIWVHNATEIEFNKQGEFTGYQGTIQDITERKQAGIVIEQLSRFPGENPYPVCRISREGMVLYVNQASKTLLEARDSGQDKRAPSDWCGFVDEAIQSEKVVHFEDEYQDGIFIFYIIPVVDSGYCNLYGFDITERKKAEQALQESEEKYRLVIENAGVGVIVIQDGQRVFSNSRIHNMYGYTKKEYDDIDFMSIVHPEDRSYVADRIKRRLLGELKDLDVVEIRAISKSGEIMWVEANSTVIQWKGKPGLQVFVADITERKKAEEALRESEQRYRSTLDNMLEGCQIIGRDWRYLYVNDAVAEQGRETKEQLLGHTMMEVYPGIENTKVFRLIQQCMEQRIPHRLENKFDYFDGRVKWFDISIQPVPEGVFILSMDITDRKKAEDERREYQARLKAMASQLSSIQERQKRQIAVELHDRITQKLAMVKLGLEALAGSFADAKAAGKVKEIAEQVGETIEDAYSLMLELSNPVLYEIGLKAAVETLLQSDLVKRCGIRCRLIAPERPMNIETDIRVALYQATRELLINAIKHSKAREIEVHLCRTHDTASVTVRDDGVGFNLSQVKLPGKEGGFGLFHIRENIGGIGGEFTIESKPGKGTSATACVPLSGKDFPTQKKGLYENTDCR
jgi:PAS domain S-box-containing protein